MRINALMVAIELQGMGLEEVALKRRWYSGGRYQTGWVVDAVATIAGARVPIHLPTIDDAAAFVTAYEERSPTHAIHPGADPDARESERRVGATEAGPRAIPQLEA